MSSRTRRRYDIISNLPDTVLGHILSFLPTKEVVATSVPSKRWRNQWCSVLDINLTNGKDNRGNYDPIELDDEYTLSSFNEFVYSVLLKLDSIKSFHLKVGYGDSALENRGIPSVVKWVDHVVRLGIESLRLTLFTSIDMKLPVSILSCRTLVVLNLFSMFVGFSSVRLPSLKILYLELCSFLNDRDLVLLLVGCPILEDLHIEHLEFHSEDSFTHQEGESLCLSLSKLTKAQMFYFHRHFPLKALHNAEKLYIELNQIYQSFDEIPTFHNLTKLKLHSINSNWNLLVQVLNHCPKLQNLELDEGWRYGDPRKYVQKIWVDPKLVPQCLPLHLKTCIFQNFLGQQGELLSTVYILKNARVLQTMIICGAKGLEIERELSLCPRASPACELILTADKISPDKVRNY